MVQGEVDNCPGSLPCGLYWSLGRTDGPFVVGVVSLGAHFSNITFLQLRLDEGNIGVCVCIATPMYITACLMKTKPLDLHGGV